MTDIEAQRDAEEQRRQDRLALRRPFIERAGELTRMLSSIRQEFEDAKAALRETYREKRRGVQEILRTEGAREWWDAVQRLKAEKKADLVELRNDYEDDRRELEAERGRVAAAMKQAEREAGYR